MYAASRRQFLQTAAASGALLGLDLAFLSGLRPIAAAETKLDPKLVRLNPEIEPLVRLLEETERSKLLEEVAQRIRKGVTYREVLAALLLAGVRNIQPRPSVGYKFHAVLVVNSAHLASLASPDNERWLPIFWALDHFKSAQASNIQEGGWRMAPVKEDKLPPARKARVAFIDAMDNWQVEEADVAVAALARHAGANEIFELFYRYGARDLRDIGHKAIFVANCARALPCIGWQHAEPVLRSLAYALLKHEGGNPAKREAEFDVPGRYNQELAEKIRGEWQEGKPSNEATIDLLATLRTGSDKECSEHVAKMLNNGVAPQSIWDALLAGAGELLMRQPGIVGLHTLTTTNAFHYAYQATADDKTRRCLMLQNAAFLPHFREAMKGRGKVGDERIDQLEEAPLAGKNAVEEIFADVSKDKKSAARKTLGYLKNNEQPKELIDAARLLIFLKGTNSHDYKFSSAVLEDYGHVSPSWRDRYLAASVFNLRGSGDSDNSLVERTRAALAS